MRYLIRSILLPLAFAIPALHAGETVYYYHNDHLGTPQAMTDQSQAVVWQVGYTPFGQAYATGPIQIENNLRFPGQYFDAESGLHYNYFRDYDPTTGRYMQSDPIGLRGGINSYGYARQSPLNFTDPLGLAVTICYFSRGVTHLGLGVNTDSTVGFYPHPDSSGFERYHGPGDVREDDQDQPKQCRIYETTAEQDRLIQEFIDQRKDDPGNYDLLGRSCSLFVMDALDAGGFNLQGTFTIPSFGFSSIQNSLSPGPSYIRRFRN